MLNLGAKYYRHETLNIKTKNTIPQICFPKSPSFAVMKILEVEVP